jgi:hypothetical protein
MEIGKLRSGSLTLISTNVTSSIRSVKNGRHGRIQSGRLSLKVWITITPLGQYFDPNEENQPSNAKVQLRHDDLSGVDHLDEMDNSLHV